MRATLCEKTLENACKAYPMLRGAILHSDRGTQYTSELYRKAINKIWHCSKHEQCRWQRHDNARCESMWARFRIITLWSLRSYLNDRRAVKDAHLEILHQLLE